jgi:hypothetical protein
MLAGLEWIGGGDGGDGILGRGDWKKFSNAQASAARRISLPFSTKLCVVKTVALDLVSEPKWFL